MAPAPPPSALWEGCSQTQLIAKGSSGLGLLRAALGAAGPGKSLQLCALPNLTTKDFLQFSSFNGPPCQPLIPPSFKSDLNALITIYCRTLSRSRAVRVQLRLFISPSQQTLSCSIHHRESPAGRCICPGSQDVLGLSGTVLGGRGTCDVGAGWVQSAAVAPSPSITWQWHHTDVSPNSRRQSPRW